MKPSCTTSLKNLSLQQKHTNSKSGSIYARLLCFDLVINLECPNKKLNKLCVNTKTVSTQFWVVSSSNTHDSGVSDHSFEASFDEA